MVDNESHSLPAIKWQLLIVTNLVKWSELNIIREILITNYKISLERR